MVGEGDQRAGPVFSDSADSPLPVGDQALVGAEVAGGSPVRERLVKESLFYSILIERVDRNTSRRKDPRKTSIETRTDRRVSSGHFPPRVGATADRSILDGKTGKLSGGRLPRDGYVINARGRRAVVAPGNQPINITGRTFDECLNVSVGKIPDPPPDTEAVSLLGRRLAEVYALYSSRNPNARPYDLVHYQPSIMRKNCSSDMIFIPS